MFFRSSFAWTVLLSSCSFFTSVTETNSPHSLLIDDFIENRCEFNLNTLSGVRGGGRTYLTDLLNGSVRLNQ